jgi:hypothetical protein
VNLDDLRIAAGIAERADLAAETLCAIGGGRVRSVVIRTTGGDVEIPAALVSLVVEGACRSLRGERNSHLATLQQTYKIEVTA